AFRQRADRREVRKFDGGHVSFSSLVLPETCLEGTIRIQISVAKVIVTGQLSLCCGHRSIDEGTRRDGQGFLQPPAHRRQSSRYRNAIPRRGRLPESDRRWR